MTSASMDIIAVAARTPVGLSAEAGAAAIRAGICRITEHPYYRDLMAEPVCCGQDAELDPRLQGPDRIQAMASRTLLELANKLQIVGIKPARVPVLLALPEPRPGFGLMDAKRIAATLSETSESERYGFDVQPLVEGHAGGVHAFELAVRQLADKFTSVCVVAGVDSYLDADTMCWLERSRRLAHARTRSGFPPGEGAAMIAVVRSPVRSQAREPALGRVVGLGWTREVRDLDSPEGSFGEGLSEAVAGATAHLAQGALVTDVYGDINGERHRTEEWGFTLLRHGHRFRDGTAYTTSVSECGELGAAGAVLSCVLAVRSWQRNYAKGSRALVWAGSWSGHRGAALLERAEI